MKLKPTLCLNSLKDININSLYYAGVKLVFLDFDNTLVALESEEISKEGKNFIDELKEKGIKIIVLSNNFSSRLEKVCQDNDLKYYSFICKPLPFLYAYLIKKEKLNNKQVVAIGDQYFTDIVPTKLIGIRSILLTKTNQKERLLTTLLQPLERWIING